MLYLITHGIGALELLKKNIKKSRCAFFLDIWKNMLPFRAKQSKALIHTFNHYISLKIINYFKNIAITLFIKHN